MSFSLSNSFMRLAALSDSYNKIHGLRRIRKKVCRKNLPIYLTTIDKHNTFWIATFTIMSCTRSTLHPYAGDNHIKKHDLLQITRSFCFETAHNALKRFFIICSLRDTLCSSELRNSSVDIYEKEIMLDECCNKSYLNQYTELWRQVQVYYTNNVVCNHKYSLRSEI
jgi:hypothetical protein